VAKDLQTMVCSAIVEVSSLDNYIASIFVPKFREIAIDICWSHNGAIMDEFKKFDKRPKHIPGMSVEITRSIVKKFIRFIEKDISILRLKDINNLCLEIKKLNIILKEQNKLQLVKHLNHLILKTEKIKQKRISYEYNFKRRRDFKPKNFYPMGY